MLLASSPLIGHHCKEPVRNPLLQTEQSYLSEPFQLREKFSSPFITLVVLFMSVPSVSVSLLYCRDQHCMQYSRCGLKILSRVQIISLSLLPTLLKRHADMYLQTQKQPVNKCNLKRLPSEKIQTIVFL